MKSLKRGCLIILISFCLSAIISLVLLPEKWSPLTFVLGVILSVLLIIHDIFTFDD